MKKYTSENLINVETYVEEYNKENEKLNRDFNITEINFYADGKKLTLAKI